MSTDAQNPARTFSTPRPLKSIGPTWDVSLLMTVVALLGFGTLMLYSASAIMAAQKLGDPMYLVKTQLIRTGLGLVLMFAALRIDYRWWRRLIYPMIFVSVIMLVLVLIPGVGVVQNGSRRWFSMGGLSFQPAEVVKIVTVIYLAYSVSKKGEAMKKFSIGFVPHLMVAGLMVELLMRQPDFGSSVLILTVTLVMLFCSGAKIIYMALMVPIAGLAGFLAITGSEYRMERVMVFLDPWKYRTDEGYQIVESLISIGSGQITGVGLGNGKGKLGYVPELWNDFIGTIIAEELGLIGIVGLVSLILLLLWRGFSISWNATDKFGVFLAFGLTTVLGIQAAANLCVVTGLLPNKGITLPFVSFGGSSMIMSLFAIGILLNISRNQPDTWEEGRTDRADKKQERKWEKKRAGIVKRRRDLTSRKWS